MIILFIDDETSRHTVVESVLGKEHTILHAYNYDEAISTFLSCKETIGLAMFDHDLGEFREEDGEIVEYNGSKLASYILNEMDEKLFPARAIAHSLNWHGAVNIASKLKSAGIHADVFPYSETMINELLISLRLE